MIPIAEQLQDKLLMDNPNAENTPEPIRLPNPPQRRSNADNDTIEINKSTLYYLAIAVLFFAAGFIVAWVTFTTRNDDIRTTASNAAREAVQTAVAGLPSGGQAAAVIQPTATDIPRQNVTYSPNAPAWGPKDAKVTVVEFSDFQCPYCELFFKNTYPLLQKNYGDKIRFVYRHYPLSSIHPDAERAAFAAECARDQDKFWEYHDTLFNNQSDLSRDALVKYAEQVGVADKVKFADCLDKQQFKQNVTDDVTAGDGYFVNGTPTFFVNGNIVIGAQSYATFKSVIDKELATGG